MPNTHEPAPQARPFSADREGKDGAVVTYRERVFPSIGMWSFTLLMTLSLGLAYGRAYGANTGLAVAMATSSVAVIALLVNSPLLVIDDKVVRAGNARLPLCYVGTVKVLDKTATARARSKRAHPNAFYSLRAGISESLLIEVTDTEDPHPYWQVSSRNAHAVADAIRLASGTQLTQ